jgi:hypothetical protein
MQVIPCDRIKDNRMRDKSAYNVLAIHFSESYNESTFYVEDDFSSQFNYGIFMKFDEVEIIDNRLSEGWVFLHDKTSNLVSIGWPEYFSMEYFHDKLTDGDQEAVHIFRNLMERAKKSPA